jgi:hypothetical protein
MSTWADVQSYIATQLVPGLANGTNVQKIRNSLQAIINQINTASLSPTNDFEWKSDVNYAADITPVLWRSRWFVSNIDNNIGVEPITSGGVVQAAWRAVNSSPGSGIQVWVEQVYPNLFEVVFANGIIYFLDRNEVGADPFNSMDFEAEVTEGIWKPIVGSAGIPEAPDSDPYARTNTGWVKLPISPPIVSSNEITFATLNTYGTFASPRTGAITASFTGAKRGIIQEVFYNNATLNIPSGWRVDNEDTFEASVKCKLFITLEDATPSSEVVSVTIQELNNA